MTRIAFYPATFDPVTNGHVDILRGALEIADSVVVAIGVNSSKSPLFSLEERQAMLGTVIQGLGRQDARRVKAITFTGLAVEAARTAGATLLIRGLRDGGDLTEMQLADEWPLARRTVFLPSSWRSVIRHACRRGGLAVTSPFVRRSLLVAKRGPADNSPSFTTSFRDRFHQLQPRASPPCSAFLPVSDPENT